MPSSSSISAAIRSSSLSDAVESVDVAAGKEVDLVLVDSHQLLEAEGPKAGQHLDATDDQQWIHLAS